jgi:UDP-glucuronate decarboxylase
VAETLFFDYERQNDVAAKVVRIFNTYGPSMNLEDGRVVSNFIVQALKGNDISIYGDGTQTRSFCYVSDLVEGLISMMMSPREVTGPINLGNPVEIPIAELAEIIIRMTQSKSRIAFHPLPSDDPKQRKPDITKAKMLLGWTPKINLDEGLALTIADFNSRVE